MRAQTERSIGCQDALRKILGSWILDPGHNGNVGFIGFRPDWKVEAVLSSSRS